MAWLLALKGGKTRNDIMLHKALERNLDDKRIREGQHQRLNWKGIKRRTSARNRKCM